MKPAPEILLIASTFLLGVRHGVDWDHIAAISDITLSQSTHRRSVWLGTVYAIGHATVVGLLGLLAIFLDIALPNWVDQFMEPVVGVTLILLGIYVMYSLRRQGSHFQLRSRWMLLWDWIRRSYDRWRGRSPSTSPERTYGMLSAYLVGVIHGVGAETPTQVILFIAAAGVAGRLTGALLVLTFLAGLFTSNTLIVLTSTYGLGQAREHATAWVVLGGVVGVFSIAVGALFVMGYGSLLPRTFGG